MDIYIYRYIFIFIFIHKIYLYEYMYICNIFDTFASQVVPHKAAAEVSKIGNLYRRSVAVNDGSQSEPADGPTSGWRQCSVVEVVVVSDRG